MPWTIVRKTYGRDPRYDAKYHIRFASVSIKFDLYCEYLDGYKWILKCEGLGADNILLGHSPPMNDQQAGIAALNYLSKVVDGISEDLKNGEETLVRHIEKESKNT